MDKSIVWYNILFNLLTIIALSAAGRNFYEILGVDRSASTNEIKKAYRKLAKSLHPDKNNNDPVTSKKFLELGNAYEILSDEDKRKMYDRCGEECVKKDGGVDNSDPFSFFNDFGFNFGGEDRGPRDTPKGGTIEMDLFVTLEELFTGNFVEVIIIRNIVFLLLFE